jgi:epoxide hydrolase-like protein
VIAITEQAAVMSHVDSVSEPVTEPTGGAQAFRPFRVGFADEALVDMKRRIAATRWPERETVSDATRAGVSETHLLQQA